MWFVFRIVSIGWRANLRLVLVVDSTGSGANLRFVLCVVSVGSGAKLRFVLVAVSIATGANLRLFVVVVSIGSGANLLGGFDVPSSASCFRSLELDAVISIGSTLKRLGGASDAMVRWGHSRRRQDTLIRSYGTNTRDR